MHITKMVILPLMKPPRNQQILISSRLQVFYESSVLLKKIARVPKRTLATTNITLLKDKL